MSELGWRKTWEDQEDEDYIYTDGSGEMFGRVYLSAQKHWRWFYSGDTGRTESRRKAMLAVELAYEKSRANKL